MGYKLLIRKQAQKLLMALSIADRKRITEKIVILGGDPNDSRLDIKPLEGRKTYRLRVGQWRVIFDRQHEIKVISIEKIKVRGDAYK
jgi:mRNA interferase RelE/StbE